MDKIIKNITKILSIIFLILIVIVLLNCFNIIKNKYISEDNLQYYLGEEQNRIEDIYSKFILGEIAAVNNNNEEYLLQNLLESSDIKYFYCDIDGDSLNELHIKSEKLYYILKYSNSLLNIIYEGSIYEYPVNNNNVIGVLYYRPGGAPEHDTYQFTTFELSGIVKSILMFEWYDDNENEIMDEEDVYLYNDSEMIGMNQWKEVTETYRSSILDVINVEWKKYSNEMADELIQYHK